MSEGADLHPGRTALKHFARILEQKPLRDDHELSRAALCLSRFREELIGVQRGAGASLKDRERLSRLNAIISVVMGLHFPLDNPPWEEFGRADAWMKDLVEEIER